MKPGRRCAVAHEQPGRRPPGDSLPLQTIPAPPGAPQVRRTLAVWCRPEGRRRLRGGRWPSLPPLGGLLPLHPQTPLRYARHQWLLTQPPRSHSAWRPARRSWRILRRGPGVTGGRALRRFSGPRAAACCGRCCRTDATAAPVLTGMKKINALIRKPVQEKCTDFPAISCVLYRCPHPNLW